MSIGQSRRGSSWEKWDLHIHTPKTFLNNNYGNCSTDEFVRTIVDSGIKVVGLTNYFHFDNEFENVRQQLTNRGVIVFPNLEFRTQPQNKDNEEMHIHMIFSEKVPISKIDGFLGRLKTVDDKYCKNLTPAEIGTVVIAYDTIKTTLENDKELRRFEDYILVACPKGQGNFRPSSSDDGRGNNSAITIDKNTDVLFGKTDDTEFFLKTDRYEGAEPKPVLSCSDAHGKDQIGSSFTWIKADCNFEGLKQILWEPASRVKIQERNPDDEKPGRIAIDKVTYKDGSGNEKEVLFNRDLNSIIGIRGSGKSTLLKNIALSVDKKQFEKKDKGDNLYNLENFKVVWGDGQDNHGTDESPKSVFFIPQNYLSLLSYDESGKAQARDEFLTDLLKKNVKFANAIRAYESFVSDNKVKIESNIEKLLKNNTTLNEAKTQLRKQGSRKEIETELNKKNEDIKKYKGTGTQALTDSDVINYTQANEVVTNDEKKLLIIEQDKEILTGLKNTGANVYIANQEITRLSSSRQQLLQTELLKKSKESLSNLIDSEIDKINQEVKVLNTRIVANKQILATLDSKIKANKAIEKLAKELSQLQQTLKYIGELEGILTQATKDKEDAISGLVEAYEAYDMQQAAIFGSIEFDERFSFLQIKIVTYYNLQDLASFVEKNINTIATSPLIIGDADIKELHSSSPAKLTSFTLKKYINKLTEGSIKLKAEIKEVGQVLSQLLKNRYEIDFLNSVKTKDDGVIFKNMTGGQKAIALLELVFRFDDERYPILIDQPEDDLDVSGIATDLVNFIKSEKSERQIIIVSHNASLVICADSEEVLVSNSTKLQDVKYDFSYMTGSIENETIRDFIIKVLEGGKEALKQRARKLNFKHEI